MISSVDSNNSKICKIRNDSKYANNCKIGIHLTMYMRKTGITYCETQYANREFQILKSQIVTSSWGGTRKLPFAFTAYGVAMLSSVLCSKRAIQVNIQIMLVFSKIREMLLDTLGMKLDIEEIKKRLNNQDKNLELVFTYLDELIEKQIDPPPRNRI